MAFTILVEQVLGLIASSPGTAECWSVEVQLWLGRKWPRLPRGKSAEPDNVGQKVKDAASININLHVISN